MKKKLIAAAISAAIAGPASAVNINPDGLGEVLIYPYYTVQSGYTTLISVVNTTEEVKAVKVRFLEGKNSREVLDFNLYLSPFDVWTAALSASEEGTILRTADTSCTVPRIPEAGVEFRNFLFTGLAADGEDESLARTREGHFEIIEMGVVDDPALVAAATHTPERIPANCDALVQAWSGGIWAQPPIGEPIAPATGGLFGGSLVVNVAEGTDVSYNALALEAFWGPFEGFHTSPGDIFPSLINVFPQSLVFFEGDVVESIWAPGTVDAVSALLMHNNIMNEFVVEAATAAGTDWVVTFPTKRFYVDPAFAQAPPPVPPFTSVFGPGPGGACEDVGLRLWDREEQTTVEDIDFSPPPIVGRNALCWETNVITFNNTHVLNSALALNINTFFESGWGRITFTDLENVLTSADGDEYQGLPAIGFAVQQFMHGDLNGLLSNYGNLFDHRATRSVIDGGVNGE